MTIDYRLDELGWYQFERLCQALLRAKYGAALQVWGATRDFGKDAYSPGPLAFPDPAVSVAGPFVFQVKFVSGANAAGARPRESLIAAVGAEMTRILARRKTRTWEDPRVYCLMTNAPVGASLRMELQNTIQSTLSNADIFIQGASDIAASLDDSPSIRMSYPQILGIRDLHALLSKTVNADIISRSTLTIDQISELAQVFVATEAYNSTLNILDNHGFAVLTGPPEIGKTAIAHMVALARFTTGWEIYDCRKSSEVFRVYDSQRSQLFIADDAFGSTEYRPDIASEWAAQIDRIIAFVGPRHWIIWTSRPGPLRMGLDRLHLQGVKESFPSPFQVQVDASKLSVSEKAEILYRHAKAAKLDAEAINVLKVAATTIVESGYFTPLRIQRLVREQISSVKIASTSDWRQDLRSAVRDSLHRSSTSMRTSFNVLDEQERALLISMLNSSNEPLTIADVDELRASYLGRMPEQSTERVAELLDDHFVKLRRR